MSWWSWIPTLLQKLGGLGGAPLSPQERALLGEPVQTLAQHQQHATPYGPVEIPLLVEARGRQCCVFRLDSSPDAAQTEELLLRFARIHSGLPETEIVLLGEFGRLPTQLAPYLRPSPTARVELLVWLESKTGGRWPLQAALRQVFGVHLAEDAGSLAQAFELLQDELALATPSARACTPAQALQAELAFALGRTLQTTLGGNLEARSQRWWVERSEGRFTVDLGRWIDVALDRPEDSGLASLPREVGRHLADPSYLLDPISFAASAWDPPPTPPRSMPTLQGALASFIEVRAEATLNQGAESQDSGDILLECPGCHGLTSLFTAFGNSDPSPVGSLWSSLYDQLHRLEHECSSCSASLSFRDFRVARYFRFLPDNSTDLAIQIARSEDGRVASSLRVFAEGGRLLEHNAVSDESVRELCGRHLSARTAWLQLLERAQRKNGSEVLRFDASSIGVVVAAEPQNGAQQLRELVQGLAPPPGSMLLRLSDLDSADLPFVEGTYHHWAGRFEPRLRERSLIAALIVDYLRLRDRFCNAMHRAGAQTEEQDGVLKIRLGRQHLEVPLATRIVEAVHMGRQLEERLASLIAETLHQLRKLEAFVLKIQEICGPGKEYRYEPDTGVLHVVKPGSTEGASFNVPSLLIKFAADEEQLERMVRAMSREAEPSLEICKCGAPAYVSLKMKPPEWANSQSGTQDVVFETQDGVIFAYSVDCEEHSGYLDRESLTRLGLGLNDLRQRFHRDLDRNDYQVGLLVLRDGPHTAVGILGTNAASLACDPALVRKALEMAGVDLGSRVRLHARSTDAIVVADPKAGKEFLQSVAEKLDHMLGQSLGLSSSALRFEKLQELPAQGRGKLREVFRVRRP